MLRHSVPYYLLFLLFFVPVNFMKQHMTTVNFLKCSDFCFKRSNENATMAYIGSGWWIPNWEAYHIGNVWREMMCETGSVIQDLFVRYRSGRGEASSLLFTHWGQVTHICVNKVTAIGSDNGLSRGRRQAIIWTNAGILLLGHVGTNFSEILTEIHTFSLKKKHFKMSSAKWRPFYLGLNALRIVRSLC